MNCVRANKSSTESTDKDIYIYSFVIMINKNMRTLLIHNIGHATHLRIYNLTNMLY